MQNQCTLKQSVEIRGVGLHTGKKVSLKLEPARPYEGIVFWRSDLKNPQAIYAKAENVVATDLATTLGNSAGQQVATVEHLLSALMAAGIDHVHCHVDGPEIPIMDGSSEAFLKLIESAGIKFFETQPKKWIRILSPIEVKSGEKSARLMPSNRFEIQYEIRFDHKDIGKQAKKFRFSLEKYRKSISKARTFGFLHQVEALQRQGLALGGGLENAVVVDQEGVMNPEGLRYSDEFVRHKILDAVGDLALLGAPMIGRLEAKLSGHEMHRLLVEKLLQETDCWEWVTNATADNDEVLESIQLAYA